ncbi:aldose 1-epimerase family protein [Vaginisenegalia massiliensis]|uniref:aldose 1-epimerase family protein n=1 Tax=Vaginisenegalia massiliensis TaxID=2058294 RepID=UPI000F5427A8|nr:aldose 1-epimerase family protein [Vaginisenegalia massiliensis]
MITLENKQLRVQIDEIGAEIKSVKRLSDGYEYIWQGNPTYWRRSAPVLFPVVGGLKEGTYQYQGQTYSLPNHGFARDMQFELQSRNQQHTASFCLKSNDQTQQMYPFDFSLQINYVLYFNQITISYEILNPSSQERLYYSIGGHPAFNVSLNPDQNNEFDQVKTKIEPAGKYLHLPIDKEGFINLDKAKYVDTSELTILHKTFRKDALVFQLGQQATTTLLDYKNKVKISLKQDGMPYVGIWSPYPKKASFVCIEPWAGIADTNETNGDLISKMGIHYLDPNQIKAYDYSISFETI